MKEEMIKRIGIVNNKKILKGMKNYFDTIIIYKIEIQNLEYYIYVYIILNVHILMI